MKVKDCMCNNVYLCTPATTVHNAAKIMQTNHVGCIPVCDNEKCIVGIVTDRDLVLRCIACDKDVKQTPISEIMTTDVCTCKPDDEMTNAQSKMGNNHIRRLPVIENGQVVGILTLGDLAKSNNNLDEEINTTMNNICNNDGENKNAE